MPPLLRSKLYLRMDGGGRVGTQEGRWVGRPGRRAARGRAHAGACAGGAGALTCGSSRRCPTSCSSGTAPQTRPRSPAGVWRDDVGHGRGVVKICGRHIWRGDRARMQAAVHGLAAGGAQASGAPCLHARSVWDLGNRCPHVGPRLCPTPATPPPPGRQAHLGVLQGPRVHVLVLLQAVHIGALDHVVGRGVDGGRHGGRWGLRGGGAAGGRRRLRAAGRRARS